MTVTAVSKRTVTLQCGHTSREVAKSDLAAPSDTYIPSAFIRTLQKPWESVVEAEKRALKNWENYAAAMSLICATPRTYISRSTFKSVSVNILGIFW